MAKRITRSRKIKEVKAVEPESHTGNPIEPDNSGLENRPFFSIDEAAWYLGVTDRCAHLWFQHGHLSGTDNMGFIRVSRESILKVKVSKLINKGI